MPSNHRWILGLALAALACSSGNEPAQTGAEVTIAVFNGSCRGLVCDSVRVFGFPDPANGPRTPGGPWRVDLGVMTGPSACFVIPARKTFTVAGPTDTTVFTWTPDDQFAVGSYPADAPQYFSGPESEDFVPSNSAGWRVTLPGGSRAEPSDRCVPSRE
jgi:hypothetical protein